MTSPTTPDTGDASPSLERQLEEMRDRSAVQAMGDSGRFLLGRVAVDYSPHPHALTCRTIRMEIETCASHRSALTAVLAAVRAAEEILGKETDRDA